MATIDISSKISYYNSGTKSTSGTKSVSGYGNALAAKNAASTAAINAANSVGAGTPASGGSSSTTDLKFGSDYGSVSKTIGTPGSSMDPDEGTYNGWCTYSSSRTSTMYQLKLVFTVPTGLTAANIASASISFTAKAGDTNVVTYYLCAPKTTSNQTTYQKYSDTTIIDTSKYVSFNSPGNTSDKSYSLTITDIFKQCITNGQGWVTILLPRDTPEGTRTMTLSGTPQITYTENYSACGAPTSVSCGTAIQKPGATVSISWSGATAGTNNTIAGYTVYYNAGSAPTTSSSSVNVSTTSYTFTIPSGATRGTTYYFKILTRGSVSGYNSGLSSAQATTKVNSLPAVPSVTVNKARIKSTGEAVTFTVTAGSDSDTGQTLSVWYNTDGSSWSGSNCRQVPSNGQLTTGTLTATTTYYFRTWDGLEYSSSYTSKTITKNTPPTISSITMSAVATYTPSTRDGYAKNINGSANGVTGTNVSYQWKLCVGSGTSATSYGTVTNISTATSLSNIDVTSYGATFNTAYKLALVVTDDLGESSSTVYSSNTYAIPAAPTISNIYNQKASGNKTGTNSSHFEDGIRIVYSPTNNTGVTRELQYSTSNNFSSYSTISLSRSDYSDVTLSSLTRGTTYYFRVKYTCNTKTTTSAVSSGYTRTSDITPNISTITPQSGSAIKPYTQSLLNFTFTNSPATWDPNGTDVATSYGSIYSIKLKYSTRELAVNSSLISHSSSSVSATVTLSSIPTSGTGSWKTLLGTTDAPNTSYTITLEVTATNVFGATFVSSKTFTANFVEGISSIGTVQLQIKTESSTYTKIPDEYNGASGLNRYHIFEGQVLRLYLNSLTCYANQSATVYFMNGNTSLGTASITSSQWTAPDDTNRLYTLNTAATILYTVPANSSTNESVNSKNYTVKVVLNNGSSLTSEGTNLKSCYHMRFSPAAINFTISTANDSSQGWTCSDWGGSGDSSNKYSLSYSSIQIQENCATSPNGARTNLGSLTDIISSPGGGTFNNSLAGYTSDIIYLGAQVKVTLGYQTIGSVTPINSLAGTSTSNYTIDSTGRIYTLTPKINLFTYYRAVPNLLYGKNFFCLNMNQPTSGRTDQLLEIAATRDTTVSPNVDRDKIYFGTDGSNFQITTNGLVIDCGSW